MHDLRCGDVVVGWDNPKVSLRSRDTVKVKLKTLGKSGNWYSEEKPVELHFALDRLASTETPVVETAIVIGYWDTAGKGWLSSCPIRYDKRTGNIEFLPPTVGPAQPDRQPVQISDCQDQRRSSEYADLT